MHLLTPISISAHKKNINRQHILFNIYIYITMYQIYKAAAITTALVISTTNAFVPTTRTQLPTTTRTNINNSLIRPLQQTSLQATESEDNAQDSEIERLKNMAAKLRAEAASLEADKANQLAEAAEKAFQKFDSNDDGEVSLSELKTGLEKELKVRRMYDVKYVCIFCASTSYALFVSVSYI